MLILDEEIDLVGNIKKSLVKYKYLWMILIISIVLDCLTTIKFMHNESISREANIIIHWLANTFGIIPGVIFGKFLQIIAALGFSSLSFKYSRAILLLLLLLNLLAVYHNL